MTEEELQRREKREEEIYSYSYTHTHTKTRKLQLYIPEVKKSVIREAKDIFKREGSSISRFVMEQLERYVDLHRAGNPQQRLDTIIETGKTYYAKKLCGFKGCLADAVAVGTDLRSGKKYPICKAHVNALKNYSDWKIEREKMK